MSSLPTTSPTPFAALIGLDWADQQQAGALLDETTGRIEQFTPPQQAEPIERERSLAQSRWAFRVLELYDSYGRVARMQRERRRHCCIPGNFPAYGL